MVRAAAVEVRPERPERNVRLDRLESLSEFLFMAVRKYSSYVEDLPEQHSVGAASMRRSDRTTEGPPTLGMSLGGEV